MATANPGPVRSPPGPAVHAGSTDSSVPVVWGESLAPGSVGPLTLYGSGLGVAGASGSGTGVWGYSDTGYGVWAQGSPGGYFESSKGFAIQAVCTADADGVNVTSSSKGHVAVRATNTGGGPALWADSPGQGGWGVCARGAQYSAWFDGQLQVNGDAQVTGTLVAKTDLVVGSTRFTDLELQVQGLKTQVQQLQTQVQAGLQQLQTNVQQVLAQVQQTQTQSQQLQTQLQQLQTEFSKHTHTYNFPLFDSLANVTSLLANPSGYGPYLVALISPEENQQRQGNFVISETTGPAQY